MVARHRVGSVMELGWRLVALTREREVEMANRKSGKRGSGVVAVVAVVAAFAAPSTASAGHGNSKAPESASPPAVVVAPVSAPAWDLAEGLVFADASWAE